MSKFAELKPIRAEQGRPLFQAVRDSVRAAIDAGMFAPGDRLPSTKAISDQLSVSLVTVHRALQELVASGVLRRGQGRGTFVHEEYLRRAELNQGLRFGVVFHDECSLADFYHGHVLEGVRRGAAQIGADLVLLRFGEDWRKECHGFLYVNPREEQLDKVPFFGTSANLQMNGHGRSHRPGVVVIGASFDRPRVHAIDSDNADIARQAVHHLADLGHRRIGYLGGGIDVSNNIDRWNGFRAAMGERGLDVEDRLVIREPGWRVNPDDREMVVEMLRASAGEGGPSAMLAAGYYFALDLYAAANKAGRSIPHDLSVISVDDPPSAQHLSPALTTMRQPLEQMGRLAAKTLFDMLHDDRPQQGPVLLRAELIRRQSTTESRT